MVNLTEVVSVFATKDSEKERQTNESIASNNKDFPQHRRHPVLTNFFVRSRIGQLTMSIAEWEYALGNSSQDNVCYPIKPNVCMRVVVIYQPCESFFLLAICKHVSTK
jgi:hypothetical protein